MIARHCIDCFLLVVLMTLVWIMGCEKNPIGTLDPSTGVPMISSARITPDSINLDAITSGTGTHTSSFSLEATVRDPDGSADIERVSYAVLSPGGAQVIAQGVLSRTNGPLPDQSVPYAGQVNLELPRSATGRYLVRFDAVDRNGLSANGYILSLSVSKQNTPPVLGPAGIRVIASRSFDSTLVLLTVAAMDSGGLSSIRTVSAKAVGTVDSSSVVMFDDGSPAHGDGMAGDGTYSLLVWIRPAGLLQQVYFEFTAQDAQAGMSPPLRKFFANQAPRIDSLDVPDQITRPASGTKTVLFRCVAFDPDGRTDIDSVYFRNLSSSSPVPILMYDDGDVKNHGDATAGDGWFSRILSIDATTSTGLKEFHFYAVDRAGARAEVVQSISIN